MEPIPAGQVDCGRESPVVPVNAESWLHLGDQESLDVKSAADWRRREPKGSRNTILLHLSIDRVNNSDERKLRLARLDPPDTGDPNGTERGPQTKVAIEVVSVSRQRPR
jgi:hypothetical protein